MVGGYTKDLKELTKWRAVTCMHRNLQYHTMNLLSTIDSLLSNTIYFDMYIQLLVTNGDLLIIRAVIMSQECTQPSGHANVSKCLLPYSTKFSSRIIFAVFADSSGTAKIKLLETFRLNFPGVRGIVWKKYDSYSTFAVLCGHQEQHGTLSLFQSKCFQIPEGRHRKFL